MNYWLDLAASSVRVELWVLVLTVVVSFFWGVFVHKVLRDRMSARNARRWTQQHERKRHTTMLFDWNRR